MDKTISTSILSGMAISIAAYLYSTLGGSIVGAFLFSFGLITVILYQWKLYTGTAGFIKTEPEISELASILFGNVIGCVLAGFLLVYCQGTNSQGEFIENMLVPRRIIDFQSAVKVCLRAIFCGFIMTTAVKFSRIGREKGVAYFLPLILGVPTFLICGFYHSIVDAFYISYSVFSNSAVVRGTDNFMISFISWGFVVAGNFIGCNLTRLITFDIND